MRDINREELINLLNERLYDDPRSSLYHKPDNLGDPEFNKHKDKPTRKKISENDLSKDSSTGSLPTPEELDKLEKEFGNSNEGYYMHDKSGSYYVNDNGFIGGAIAGLAAGPHINKRAKAADTDAAKEDKSLSDPDKSENIKSEESIKTEKTNEDLLYKYKLYSLLDENGYVPCEENANTLFEMLLDEGTISLVEEDISVEVLNNLRADLEGELEAIRNYEERADIAEKNGYEDIAETLRDIRDEEKVHVGELISLLEKYDSAFNKSVTDGKEEVTKESVAEEYELYAWLDENGYIPCEENVQLLRELFGLNNPDKKFNKVMKATQDGDYTGQQKAFKKQQTSYEKDFDKTTKKTNKIMDKMNKTMNKNFGSLGFQY